MLKYCVMKCLLILEFRTTFQFPAIFLRKLYLTETVVVFAQYLKNQ